MGHDSSTDDCSTYCNAMPDISAEETADRQRRIIDDARSYWTKRAKVEITSQDAHEILTNLAGFFAVLSAWSTREDETANGGSGHREE